MTERLAAVWQEFVRSLQPDTTTDLDILFAEGGYLRMRARRGIAETWTEMRAERAESRLSVLDLDGWEPDTEHLGGFAAYLQTLRGLEEMPPAGRGAGGAGALDAARLSLAVTAGDDGTFASHDLLESLRRAAEKGRRVFFVPDGDLLPINVRHALADTCVAGSGCVWVDLHPPVSDEAPDTADLEIRLSTDGPEAAELRSVVDELRSEVASRCADSNEGSTLARALSLWSRLDRPWPLEPVLMFLGLDEDAREDAVDRVDDELLEDGLNLLNDLQFLHPSFKHAVYGPAEPWSMLVLQGLETEGEGSAENLGHDLRRRFQPRRGTFVVLQRLAALTGDAHEADALARRLRWGFEPDGLDGVARRALRDGDCTPEELWQSAADPFAPPGHRLVMLQSWAETEEGARPTEQGRHLMLRSEILQRLGRLSEALEAAQQCIEIQSLSHGPKSSPYLGAVHQTAMLLLEAERAEEAIALFEVCTTTAPEILGYDDPKIPMILENHGMALARGGRLREARERLETALEHLETRRGSDHTSTAYSRNNLAGLLLEMGELEAAVEHLEKAATVFEKRFGARSMELYGTLRNLAKAQDDLGRHEDAEALLERVASLEEGMLGPSHPALIGTWARLAELKRDRGESVEARFLYGRALELALEIFDADDPSIPALKQAAAALDAEAGASS